MELEARSWITPDTFEAPKLVPDISLVDPQRENALKRHIKLSFAIMTMLGIDNVLYKGYEELSEYKNSLGGQVMMNQRRDAIRAQNAKQSLVEKREQEERLNEEYHAAVAAVEPLLEEFRKTDFKTHMNRVMNMFNDLEQIDFSDSPENLIAPPYVDSSTSRGLRDEHGRFRAQTPEDITQELQNRAKIKEIDNYFHPFGECSDHDYVIPFDDPDR
jgi:hypothetical protein